MTEWGPGAPETPLSTSESDSEEESPEEPKETEEEAETESEPAEEEEQTDLFEYEESTHSDDWFEGDTFDAISKGEYGFLPVFGFNESNIAARKYALEYGFEDDDTVINVREDEPLTIEGKELTWWEDESIMPKHPYLLINPLGFASVDPEEHNFRKVFRLQKGEQFVFSDSGGYQLMSMEDAEIVDTREENDFKDYAVHPERLLEWQVANADAGATIDYPPYNISGDSSFPDKAEWGEEWFEFFEHRLDLSGKMTYRMAKRLNELREEGDDQAEDYIFTPVIHGKPHPEDTHKLVQMWHEEQRSAASKAGVEPRGWVLKPEPSHNFGQIAMFLGYAAEHLTEADYIHVLMVGGLLQKALLMYYAKLSDHFVTSDASSYAAGGMRRQFDLPKTATRRSVIISSRDEDDENAAQNPNDLERYPCRCQVCDTIERELGFEFVTEGSGSARSVSLNLHNLNQIINVERTLDALLREEDTQIVETGGDPTGAEFWRYVSSIGSDARVEDLYRSMDYVRLAVEEGLDAANRRYRILWDRSQGKTIMAASGSGSAADW